MINIRPKKIGMLEFCMVTLLLIIAAGMLMACTECGDVPFPPVNVNETNDVQEVGEIDVGTQVDSQALQITIIVVMILTLCAIVYTVSRRAGQKKNLSRQQKRAQTKQQEKKQNKNNGKNTTAKNQGPKKSKNNKNKKSKNK